MNFIKYNRTVAWCVLIVIILAAIPLGANLSVARLEKSLVRIYEEDSPRYGSPRADLRRLADYSEQLCSIASAVLGEDASFRDEVEDLRRLGESDPLRQKEAAETAERAASAYGVTFLYRDFRPYFRAGQDKARELGFYMQKYCGCVFSEEERYLKANKIIP